MKKIIICFGALLFTTSIAFAQNQDKKNNGNVLIDAASGLTISEQNESKPYIVNNDVVNPSQPIVHISKSDKKENTIVTKKEDTQQVESKPKDDKSKLSSK